MTRKQKKLLVRIGLCALLYGAGFLVREGSLPIIFQMSAYIVISYDIFRKSCRNLFHGDLFDENFLMAIASLGAILLGQPEEAVAVVLFYQIGEWFQSWAVHRSRKDIAALMDIRPDYANVEEDGKLVRTDPDSVAVGDVIVIQPGERVPLDGIILQGTSSLDTAALTGESMPRNVEPGMEIASGCINQSGVLKVKVTRSYDQGTVARILELVENAAERKAPAERFITRFAKVYTPAVCGLALLLAVVPSLLDGNWSQWVYRALTFLVISCPCALVISVPMSFFGGIGGASRAGILVKGSTSLEQMAHVKTVVFDKTGTITKGSFAVSAVQAEPGFTEDEVLNLAAAVEAGSTHPIARSIVKAASPDPLQAADVQEISGKGMEGIVEGKRVQAGSPSWLGLKMPAEEPGTVVCVKVNGVSAGFILIQDELKADSRDAIAMLERYGVSRVVMLTGDNEWTARRIGDAAGIREVRAGLLPQDKVAAVQELIDTAAGPVAFVGDGINDAPVLTLSDVGIAMGGLGSDAAVEAADIVLMNDRLSQVVLCMQAARRTMAIVWQNIVFAIGVKVLVLVLGALGLAGMWAAVFADVGVAFLCILNAMRALQVPKLNVL